MLQAPQSRLVYATNFFNKKSLNNQRKNRVSSECVYTIAKLYQNSNYVEKIWKYFAENHGKSAPISSRKNKRLKTIR